MMDYKCQIKDAFELPPIRLVYCNCRPLDSQRGACRLELAGDEKRQVNRGFTAGSNKY